MNKLIKRTSLAALMCAGFAVNANAQDCPEFSDSVYADFPNADDYCLGVVTRDDGNDYARFEAEVVSQSPSGTYVRYTKADGTKGPSTKVSPDAEHLEAQISGQKIEIQDLKPRQQVRIYLGEKSWAPEPVAAAAAPPPPPPPAPEPEPVPEPEPAPVMPATAGSLGWLAIFGSLFLVLGGALRFSRQQ